MDAVKFLDDCNIDNSDCDYESLVEAVKTLAKAVETWAAEYPRKTRQDVFLEQWPDAQLDARGILTFTPCQLNTHIICKQMACTKEKDIKDCTSCRREFWMEEAE